MTALQGVEVISACDGDTIVVRPGTPVTARTAALLKDNVRKSIDARIEVLVLPHDVNVSLVRGARAGRVQELLEANNGYLERAREAERKNAAALSRIKARTADHVLHKPSGETWVLAYADHAAGKVSACGWPDCEADLADCVLVYAATDAEYQKLLSTLTERRGEKARRIAFEEDRR